MSLKDRLMDDMKAAMKDKADGKVRLAVIRMVRAALRQAEIDGQKELDDDGVQSIIAKELKTRKDSLEEFQKGGRDDLVAQTEAEIAVLLPYLPEQLDEAAIRALVQEAITASGAASPKDMGKVMGVLMPKVKGRADGKLVNTIVREMLPN
ncbi:GatB/YqeY domain-containing protein [Selenomonas sp. TAMA-11512]|uniref:GatB/YqeY domain-containing protein n=1 Tax=Selenomonas sp. TAMA-11512 TaxID=3095337 RepID=UPI00308FE849|nr:GatB/YqeY domain-containing protein [Selenomonas sp. TAMA-11512]